MAEPIDKPEIDARIKNFTYYFLRKIEDKFTFYLDILEEHSNSKPASTVGSAISAATSFIPYVGKGASGTVKEGDTIILKKLDKKNAIATSEIVYFHKDNKESVRKLLAKAAYELFCCFEMQFMEITCDGGHTRAMQKLGYDAGQRFLSYITSKKSTAITTELVLDSIVLDTSSLLNSLGIVKSGRTLKDSDEKSWNSSEIYSKVGLYIKETDACYFKKISDIITYGYRLKFAHESLEDIEANWEKCDPVYNYKFTSKVDDFEIDYPSIIEYICKQDPNDYAKYDREMKYDEIIKILSIHHMELLADSANKYLDAAEHRETLHSNIIEETNKHHQEVTTMLSKISETQETLVRQENSKPAQPLQPAIELVNKIVEDKIKDVNEGSVSKKLGQELNEQLKKLDPTRTHEFKRLKKNIRKIRF